MQTLKKNFKGNISKTALNGTSEMAGMLFGFSSITQECALTAYD